MSSQQFRQLKQLVLVQLLLDCGCNINLVSFIFCMFCWLLNVSIILCGLNSKHLSGAASGRSSAAAPLANEDQRRCLRLISFTLAQRCFVGVIYTARGCRALPEGFQCVCDVWRRFSLDSWVKNVPGVVAMQTEAGLQGNAWTNSCKEEEARVSSLCISGKKLNI